MPFVRQFGSCVRTGRGAFERRRSFRRRFEGGREERGAHSEHAAADDDGGSFLTTFSSCLVGGGGCVNNHPLVRRRGRCGAAAKDGSRRAPGGCGPGGGANSRSRCGVMSGQRRHLLGSRATCVCATLNVGDEEEDNLPILSHTVNRIFFLHRQAMR